MGTALRVATLAWDDARGRVTMNDHTPFQHALAGGDLVDAIACGAVGLDGDRVVEGAATAGIPADATDAVGRVVADVRKRKRPRKARDVVSTLAGQKRQARAIDDLVAAGVLVPRPRRFWVVELAPSHHLTDPEDVAAQRAHLGEVLRGHVPATGLDDRTLAAVALLAPTSLVSCLIGRASRAERKAARERAHDLVEDPAVGIAVKQAIEAAEAAIAAVVIGAGAAASSG